MARAQNDNISLATFIADTDLSGSANLYRFVKAASTSGNVALANGGSNPGPIGVLYEAASAGQAVGVKTYGHSLVVGRNSGCNLDIGDYIVCASDGCAQSVSSIGAADGIAWGRWLGPTITTGSAIGEVMLFPIGASALAQS